MGNVETIVGTDPTEHARLGAEVIGRAIVAAVEARGIARIALSGGSTPVETYCHLSDLALPWKQTEWFWVDERAVAPASERANYNGAIRDLGLFRNRVSPGYVHRMPASAGDLEWAARSYEADIRASFGVASAACFDVMTMGVGDDGHTASLFPGTGAIRVHDRLVTVVRPGGGLEARLSMTAPVITQAALLVILCTGAKKRPVIEKAISKGDLDEIPSRLFQHAAGRVAWVVDREAAGSSAA